MYGCDGSPTEGETASNSSKELRKKGSFDLGSARVALDEFCCEGLGRRWRRRAACRLSAYERDAVERSVGVQGFSVGRAASGSPGAGVNNQVDP